MDASFSFNQPSVAAAARQPQPAAAAAASPFPPSFSPTRPASRGNGSSGGGGGSLPEHYVPPVMRRPASGRHTQSVDAGGAAGWGGFGPVNGQSMDGGAWTGFGASGTAGGTSYGAGGTGGRGGHSNGDGGKSTSFGAVSGRVASGRGSAGARGRRSVTMGGVSSSIASGGRPGSSGGAGGGGGFEHGGTSNSGFGGGSASLPVDGALTSILRPGSGTQRPTSASRLGGTALRPTSASGSRPSSAHRPTSGTTRHSMSDAFSSGHYHDQGGDPRSSNGGGGGGGYSASASSSARSGPNKAPLSAKLADAWATYKGGPTAGRMVSAAEAPPRREGQRPRGYTCYLCGQQFGSKSLHIHITACQKKWEMVEAAKLPRQRRRAPLPPPEIACGDPLPVDARGIDEFNCAMSEYWSRVSLIGCPHCGRTFREEAFEKHAKVCTAANPGGPLGPGRNMPVKGATARPAASSYSRSGGGGGGGGNYDAKPRGYMCYLCGSQYGSASLAIHIPQCYEKWLKVEAAKAPKERRDPPPPPEELDYALPTTAADVDAFNERMSALFNGASLVPCRNCGRTFRPEALAHHRKACTADNPMKAAGGRGTGGDGGGSSGGAPGKPAGAMTEQAEGDQELLECEHCLRRMRPEALSKHQKVCTAASPMKGVNRAAASNASPAGVPPSPHHPVPSPPGQRPPSSGGRPSRLNGGPGGAANRQQGGGGGGGAYPSPDDGEQAELSQCSSCGRSFAPHAYNVHVRICAKVNRPRKVFNSAAHRVKDTDAAQFFRKGAATSASPPSRQPAASSAAGRSASARGDVSGWTGGGRTGRPKPTWKLQSEALRAAMAAQRQVARAIAHGGSLKDIPYVPSGPDPGSVQCPHCGRYFSQQAGGRHIPACAGTTNKPKFLKRGTGGAGKGAPDSKPLPRYR